MAHPWVWVVRERVGLTGAVDEGHLHSDISGLGWYDIAVHESAE